MCSTSCDCDEELSKVSLDSQACRRCDSKPFIVLDKVHLECKDCFLQSCNKKIRSTIGKSNLLRNNDAILVAYSGGMSSSVLLDLLKKSMESELRREQKFRPSILHIDMQSVLEKDFHKLNGYRENKLLEILQDAQRKYPSWPIYWSTIEMVTRIGNQSNRSLFQRYQHDKTMDSSHLLTDQEAFNLMHERLGDWDLTIQQKLVQDQTVQLIKEVSSDINKSIKDNNDKFKFVFSGSSSTQLANDLLVNVILGEGSTVHSTVNFCDPRSTISLLRPMRDFSKKEIAFYTKATNLHHYNLEDLSTYADRKASIQNATEAFLGKLSVDYPATCSTLLKTGNKMQEDK